MIDYSEWLTPERLEHEETLWASVGLHKTYAAWVQQSGAKTVLEVGCGTGWVPTHLKGIDYTGLDANPGCIGLAIDKNPDTTFLIGDIRDVTGSYDLVCAFAVFKHFALHEWDTVVANVLRCGAASVFTMNVGPEDTDDGTEFPHVWVTMDHLQRVVESAGHVIRRTHLMQTGETMVRTARA